uniref:Lebercilin LCA5 n=1 Tax=Latimeria chalumnae TaxID=7897 RepID=H3AQD7_LATCH
MPWKKGPRWGFRSQSLNKEPPPKDIDLVTKRMLSARLLKINELRNEVTEYQIKLDETQKENKALKRLQYRQEKALNKFEDTENEISQLISRHNNEVRTLRERLRKSQERERATEKRVKDTEDELYRTKSALQKLKKLSEDKHLAERDQLAKKLEVTEVKLQDSEQRIQDLVKKDELYCSSFQRQLATERKKANEAQEEIQNLREELQRLNQKLKEKERELDTKNIYANRMLRPSPKKDTDFTPKKKATCQNNTKGVQTEDYYLPIEFTPPPPPPTVTDEQGNQEKIEQLRQERERKEREQEKEEKLKNEQEQRALEERAQKLREEWEREELERKRKEDQFLQEDLKREADQEQNWQHFEKSEGERRKKELLLAKMLEIDRENESSLLSDTFKTEAPPKYDTPNKTQKVYKFSEPVENAYNGQPAYGYQEILSKTEGSGRRGIKTIDLRDDLTFGNYAPSFGKGSGRTSLSNQRNDSFEDKSKETIEFNTVKDKKSNLLEQLFGSNVSVNNTSKVNDSKSPSSISKTGHDTDHYFPWDQGSTARITTDKDHFLNGQKSLDSTKQHSQLTTSRPTVRAIDSLEDEIEEVVL